MRKYYLPYNEKANINYVYILCLYDLCKYNEEEKLYNTIEYISLSALAKDIQNIYNISISSATLSRILNNEEYKTYLLYQKEEKKIYINNNIKQCKKFICLNEKEVKFFLKQNDNLLIKYYLYHKYYCNYNKIKYHDSTIKQMLSALGYSNKANNYINKFCQYNNLLSSNGFISIDKYRDTQGKERNVYKLIY